MSDLKVIACGLPRTGTNSLQAALEILGFGPCYHMYEVLKDHRRAQAWNVALQQVRRGESKLIDFDSEGLLKGYKSGVDAPVSEVYLELLKRDPELKVILTYRPAKEWITSCENTILRILNPVVGALIYWVPSVHYQRLMVLQGLWPLFDARYGGFNEQLMDKRIEEAKREVPKERLLVYRVQEGWGPLCEFLNVPLPPPSVPFPRVNDAASIKVFMLKKVALGVAWWVALGIAGWGGWRALRGLLEM